MIALAYVLALALIALGVPLALSLGARVNTEVRSQAQGQADLVAATAAELIAPVRPVELGRLAQSASRSVRGRVIIVDHSGRVVADSAGSADVGVSYAQRPEVGVALRGHQVQTQRHSQTLGQDILATAVPVIRGGAVAGAVRVTQSVSAVHSAVRRAVGGLVLVGVVVLALGLSAGAFIAGQVARPLRRLQRVAKQIAGGDLDARATVEGSTEQRSLAESFNEMTDRIVRLLAAQRDFVADASHQLRTPLTALRLRLDEARAAGVGPQAARQLDAGTAELERVAQIIDELLVLSRAGERELPGERVALADLVHDAVDRWRRPAGELRVSLAVHGDQAGAAWCARADAERALDALVENAVRYSRPGGAVALAARGSAIEVRDRGPGLAEGEEELVFDRFHRGSAGRAGPPGTGLGLSIARELAHEWHGEVTIANRPGGGAVATLKLRPAP